MTSRQTPGEPATIAIARLLAAIALSLLASYVITTSLVMFPPRLLNPDWQWRVSASLIDNAPTAVIGCGLFHLARYVDPQNRFLDHFVRLFAHMAGVAAVAFLLLIPLEILSVANGLALASNTRSKEIARLESSFSRLRQDIQSAPDPGTLQRRLPASLAMALGPVAFDLPLPQTKARLLATVKQAQKRAEARLSAASTPNRLAIFQKSLRIILSAPVYAIAFAAMAFGPNDRLSLLDRLLFSLSRWRQGRWWQPMRTDHTSDILRMMGDEPDQDR